MTITITQHPGKDEYKGQLWKATVEINGRRRTGLASTPQRALEIAMGG
jgi:hypothetical protein